MSLFARYWTPGASEGAGAWHRDEIRDIHGSLSFHRRTCCGVSGAFTFDGQGVLEMSGPQTSEVGYGGAFFHAYNIVPTGPENVPSHVWQPATLYLGRVAQI